MTETANNGDQRRDQLGRFGPNNGGRKPGSLNRSTQLARLLLARNAGKLVTKCVEMALAGDTTAMRLCIERLAPVARHEPNMSGLNLPPMQSARDLPAVTAALLVALLGGEVALPDMLPVLKLLEVTAQAINVGDHDARLSALERAAERLRNARQ